MLNWPARKAGVPATVPWVRIPPPPRERRSSDGVMPIAKKRGDGLERRPPGNCCENAVASESHPFGWRRSQGTPVFRPAPRPDRAAKTVDRRRRRSAGTAALTLALVMDVSPWIGQTTRTRAHSR